MDDKAYGGGKSVLLFLFYFARCIGERRGEQRKIYMYRCHALPRYVYKSNFSLYWHKSTNGLYVLLNIFSRTRSSRHNYPFLSFTCVCWLIHSKNLICILFLFNLLFGYKRRQMPQISKLCFRYFNFYLLIYLFVDEKLKKGEGSTSARRGGNKYRL